ncbi:acyl-CoA dehydrogenase family protein [Luteimonas wenzhouensis]|uniref:acyl-CoA dehydrogenase family protein n=1 Tax=Luteimonas wenzhouensis TaxID=2599615 RepID=UPI001C950625|nr:acyl-CoA dehydrogenase family protein [Luteimonas wenzhouensis]
MSLPWQPPLDDIAFLLGPWLRARDDWKRIPRFAALDLDTAEAVLAEAGRFCAEVLAPLNAVGDLQGCRLVDGCVRTPDGFAQAYRRYVADGWPALARDPEWGGQGLPALLELAFTEMQVGANHAWTMYPGLLAGAVACLQAHASPDVQARFLPPLVGGEWLATMCLTEPQAGSDLSLLRTRAVPAADGSVRITGAKVFISGGGQDLTPNIVHLVLARLPDAPPGTRGISLFVVPDMLEDGSRNGVFVDGLEHKMGLHGSATTALRFEGAVGWRVGEAHRGLPAMFVMMNAARLHAAMQGVAHAARASELAHAYAHQRRQMRAEPRMEPEQPADPIAAHPPIRHLLRCLRGWSEQMRAAGYWLGHLIDLHEHAPDADERRRAGMLVELLTPVAKAHFTECGHLLANRALQAFGGYGYVREYGIEQVVRDSRIAMIYEGSNEIQALDLLQRKLLADDGARLTVFADECERVAAKAEGAGLAAAAGVLRRLCRRLSAAFERVRAAAASDASAPARVADTFLRATGQLLLACACVRTAAVASGDTGAGADACERAERALWMLGELRLEFNAQLARLRATS